MACRGPSREEEEQWKREREKEAKKSAAYKRLVRKNDNLSALLCSTCRELESQEYDFGKNPELDRWWDKHKKADIKREEKEARERLQKAKALEIAKKPFNELTKEDKEFLREHGLL